jgi:hypothetical protein
MPLRTTCIALILLVFVYVLQVAAATRSRSYHPAAFTIMSAKANRNRGEIYNIPGTCSVRACACMCSNIQI